jgi:hypothetical protein
MVAVAIYSADPADRLRLEQQLRAEPGYRVAVSVRSEVVHRDSGRGRPCGVRRLCDPRLPGNPQTASAARAESWRGLPGGGACGRAASQVLAPPRGVPTVHESTAKASYVFRVKFLGPSTRCLD